MAARYGLEDERGWSLTNKVERGGSTMVRTWWRIGKGQGKVGVMFWKNLKTLVGRGDRARF